MKHWIKAGVFVVIAVLLIVLGAQYNKRLDRAAEQQAEAEVQAQKEVHAKLMEQLIKKDVIIGSGKEAKSGDTVSVHYIGTFDNGDKFDSSHDRGVPFEFIIGKGQVIEGWDLGVPGMKVGGTRNLTIPPGLGYGANAVGPIPANSTLHFTIELLDVEGAK